MRAKSREANRQAKAATAEIADLETKVAKLDRKAVIATGTVSRETSAAPDEAPVLKRPTSQPLKKGVAKKAEPESKAACGTRDLG